jgi:predicted phosphohydrolase
MTKLGWLTDIHLDHIEQNSLVEFIDMLREQPYAGYVLSGDISVASSLIQHLKLLDTVEKPIYFVCGNHDMWGSYVSIVRDALEKLVASSTWLNYLTNKTFVQLSKKTVMIGHDSWYDMFGHIDRTVFMNDWRFIGDFYEKSYDKSDKILSVSRKLASDSVLHLKKNLMKTLSSYDEFMIVTHVPPFPESHKFEGGQSDPKYVPFYTCQSMGHLLLDVAKAHPNKKFTSISGHTHSQFDQYVLPNLRVCVGKAKYGSPMISGEFVYV